MFCHKVLITCSRRDYLTKPYFRHTAGAMLLKARNAWLSAVLHLVGLSLFLGRTRKKVCNCACLDKFSLSWNWETATIWISCLGTLVTGNFYRYLSVGIWHYQGWWLGPYWHVLKWDSRALFFSLPLDSMLMEKGDLSSSEKARQGWSYTFHVVSILERQASHTARGRPSSYRTFSLRTCSNIFRNSLLRFRFFLLLKENERAFSTTVWNICSRFIYTYCESS